MILRAEAQATFLARMDVTPRCAGAGGTDPVPTLPSASVELLSCEMTPTQVPHATKLHVQKVGTAHAGG